MRWLVLVLLLTGCAPNMANRIRDELGWEPEKVLWVRAINHSKFDISVKVCTAGSCTRLTRYVPAHSGKEVAEIDYPRQHDIYFVVDFIGSSRVWRSEPVYWARPGGCLDILVEATNFASTVTQCM
jgi:hypothetical protein